MPRGSFRSSDADAGRKRRVNFQPTPVNGVTLVDSSPHLDARGSFCRLWCLREFEDAAVAGQMVQVSLSETRRRGTLRGMHFQLPPSREGKLVRCVAGRIFDVAVDLRPNSKTFLAHFGAELAAGGHALYIPPGCAHGFLTLTDDCAVLYMMTDFYEPTLQAGVRWNDPRLNIEWPQEPVEVLPRDTAYPDLNLALLEGFVGY